MFLRDVYGYVAKKQIKKKQIVSVLQPPKNRLL